jgi:predicted transcriptional regulator with HTH domain
MSLDKYRYTIYPDRIYVIEIDKGVKIELRGSEILEMLGVDSYFYED